MILGRNVEQDDDMSGTRTTTLALLLLELSPFLCLNLISCPLCTMNTLQNILMILGRNVEQDQMSCYIQEC